MKSPTAIRNATLANYISSFADVASGLYLETVIGVVKYWQCCYVSLPEAGMMMIVMDFLLSTETAPLPLTSKHKATQKH